MERGDFTGITHEKLNSNNVTHDDFAEIRDEYYYNQEKMVDKQESHLKNYLLTMEDIKLSPKDKLPTTVHDKLVRIIDKQNLELDLEEYQSLIEEINKLT